MKLCPECKGVCRDADRICPGCGSEVSSALLLDGDKLSGLKLADKYELTEYIGEGAMGWVYRGVHLTLESSVAVKIMKPQLRPDEQRAERFKREARASSRLNHPHIISVVDFGDTPSGLLYLVTEYLLGQSLGTLISSKGILPFKRIVRIIGQILSALEESHNSGVIHRDLKPDNIMVSQLRGGEDFVKVLDFGIAKLRDDPSQKLTQQGQLFGTPDYMAPEQIKGQEITASADLYSLGIILFQMLTGQLPFQAENFFDVLKDHLYTKPPRLNDRCLDILYPEELQLVLDRALAKDPASRFSSASAFRQALRRSSRLVTGPVRKCPSCRQFVDREVHFCPNCGARIVDPGTDPKAPAPELFLDMSHFGPDQTDPSLAPRTARESHPTLDRLWASLSLSIPLMDRAEEKKTIQRLFAGEISVVNVVGPTGMGKTSLARLARQQASEASLLTYWIEPHPCLLPLPWGPVRNAVGQALGPGPRPSEEELTEAVSAHPALARDLPGLLTLFCLPGPLDQLDQSDRQNEVMSASLRSLLLTARKPVLFVFEDGDLYDEPSRIFLEKLVSRVSGFHLRVIITSGIPMVSKECLLEIAPFPSSTVASVIDRLLPKPSDSWTGMIQKIVGSSGGNPLWIQQSLALATESGLETSNTLADLMATRIKRLPVETQQIIQAVAVLGLDATLNQLNFLLDRQEAWTQHIQLAVYLGFLENPAATGYSSSGPDARHQSFIGHLNKVGRKLRLSHPLLVQVIRETLPAEIRQRLNRKAYELLKHRNPSPAILAHHAAEAGEHELALSLLESAADQAVRESDPSSASSLYKQAADISRWKLLVDDNDPRWLNLSLKLGEALLQSNDVKAAFVVLKSVEGSCSRHPLLAAQIHSNLARVMAEQDCPSRAVEMMHQAIGDAIMGGDPDVLTEMYLKLSDLMTRTKDFTTAIEELKEGVDLVTGGAGLKSTSGPVLLWKLMIQVARLLFDASSEKEDLMQASTWTEAALRHADRSGSRAGLAQSHLMLADILTRAGQSKDALLHYETALELLRALGHRKGQALCLLKMSEHTGSSEDLGMSRELASEIDWQEGALEKEASRRLNA